MKPQDVFEARCVLLSPRISDKRQAIDLLAKTAAGCCSIGFETIRARLTAREDLGSTGLGHGFALPHARIEGLERMFGLVLRLARPIAFQAIDGEPVDLIVCLLSPPDAAAEQVGALSWIARRVRQPGRVEKIRAAKTAESLLTALATP
jgi:PTS system nitrogen regulatory IIA component